MVRVDVYHKNGKFFLVPYYVADIAKKVKKNRAITQNKNESDWDLIDSTYEFRCSLFGNDLVRVADGKGKDLLAYYKGTLRGTGAITLISRDGAAEFSGVGVKTAKVFEKYQVDVLGNYYAVKGEKPPYGLA